jgi:hypothetical protein
MSARCSYFFLLPLAAPVEEAGLADRAAVVCADPEAAALTSRRTRRALIRASSLSAGKLDGSGLVPAIASR